MKYGEVILKSDESQFISIGKKKIENNKRKIEIGNRSSESETKSVLLVKGTNKLDPFQWKIIVDSAWVQKLKEADKIKMTEKENFLGGSSIFLKKYFHDINNIKMLQTYLSFCKENHEVAKKIIEDQILILGAIEK